MSALPNGPFRLKSRNILLFGIIVLSLFMMLPAGADTIVYSEGFEASDGGYTASGYLNQWQWGTPTFGPASAHSGVKVWGTNLAGEVPSGSDSYLTSPAIAIPAISSDQIVRVRFWGWIAVDEMLDRGEFQVSNDNINWITKCELFHTMSGDWTEYWFDVSNYAGGTIYLRYKLHADSSNAFSQSAYNMAGLYIDDIAIIISDKPATTTTLTLNAYEDQSSWASCPWIYFWDGTSFVKDNDVYSTARGKTNEYTDYYTLKGPVLADNDKYVLKLQETDQESSYTDHVQLITIDHPAQVKIATDENGNIRTYSNPVAPVSAIDKTGVDVLSQISNENNVGVKVFNNDYVDLDFSNQDISTGATLVLRAIGFQADGAAGNPTYADPSIRIQTQDNSGNWITRGTYNPRVDWATNAYNLKDVLTFSKKVRLVAASCHENKYHIIDYAALDTSPQSPITVAILSPQSAIQSVNGDILGALLLPDNNYASMTPGESISLEFAVPESTGSGTVRDFVFVSKGYYEPQGTYFIYTWDGSNWAQRDGWTVSGSGDMTKAFDLSSWMPDPAGDYKVRIWQDYWYDPAGINYVGLSQGATDATMISAFDLRKNLDVTNQLISIDGNRDEWGISDSGYPYNRARNRWVEVKFTGLTINTPPTTNPVTVTDICSETPTISWTYNDVDSDIQQQYDVQVWTGAGGTGTVMWNPVVGTGDISSVTYAGTSLTAGETYYARIRAFDGKSWGGWSEASWTYPEICVPTPEFPSTLLPAAMILGVLGCVLCLRRIHKN